MLFAVPRGRIASGLPQPAIDLATLATVPSPPATTTRSAGSPSAPSQPSCFVERYSAAYPAAASTARRVVFVGRSSPALGLWRRITRTGPPVRPAHAFRDGRMPGGLRRQWYGFR